MKANTQRKPSNLSLDPDLVAEAQSLAINLSRSAEEGIRRAVASEKARRWKEENADALDDCNRWIERNGLPLAKLRLF